jgi:hypothetical protein
MHAAPRRRKRGRRDFSGPLKYILVAHLRACVQNRRLQLSEQRIEIQVVFRGYASPQSWLYLDEHAEARSHYERLMSDWTSHLASGQPFTSEVARDGRNDVTTIRLDEVLSIRWCEDTENIFSSQVNSTVQHRERGRRFEEAVERRLDNTVGFVRR